MVVAANHDQRAGVSHLCSLFRGMSSLLMLDPLEQLSYCWCAQIPNTDLTRRRLCRRVLSVGRARVNVATVAALHNPKASAAAAAAAAAAVRGLRRFTMPTPSYLSVQSHGR